MASALNVTNALHQSGQTFRFETSVEIEPLVVLGDPVRFEEVAVKGEFVGTDQTISVTAEITAHVYSQCARCLEPVDAPIEATMDAEFVREPEPSDPDLYSFEGFTIDITEAVKDALVLELPLRFLCKEDCKGLCPQCGTNLNTGSCACQREDDDNPFSVLRSIVIDNEEV